MYNTVIIIDSGINTTICKENIVGGISFTYKNRKIVKMSNYFDNNGHGTACCCAISSICKESKFYIIKVLNNNGNASIELLIAALKYCSSLEYNVINLSLATLDTMHIDELKKVCQKLKDQGKIIISSVFNRYSSSYPASFDSVIGVRGGVLSSNNEFWFNSKYEIECIANIVPQFTKRELDNYMLFGGNSKACAYITGYIMNIIKDDKVFEIDKVRAVLQKKSVKDRWKESDINDIVPCIISKNTSDEIGMEHELERIKTIIYKVDYNFQVLELEWNDNLYKKKIVTPSNCKKIIESIEEEYRTKIIDNYINFFSFATIKSLFELVKGDKNENNG